MSRRKKRSWSPYSDLVSQLALHCDETLEPCQRRDKPRALQQSMTTASSDRASAAAALADLFYNPPDSADKSVVQDVRTKYRDWRVNGSHAAPTADVLDLKREAAANEQKKASKMRRVQTVGARLSREVRKASNAPLHAPQKKKALSRQGGPPSFGGC